MKIKNYKTFILESKHPTEKVDNYLEFFISDSIADKISKNEPLNDIIRELRLTWDPDDYTDYLHQDGLLCAAAYYNNINMIDYALSIGAKVDGHLHTRPIVWAIKNRKLNALSYLISKGADVTIQDNDAIKIAGIIGNLQQIDLLIENGANPNEIYFPYQRKGVMEHLMDQFENYDFLNQLFLDCQFTNTNTEYKDAADFAIKYLDKKLESDPSFIKKFKIFPNHEIYWPEWFLKKWEYLLEIQNYSPKN